MEETSAGAAAKFLQELKGRGLRLTSQRETLFGVVAEFMGRPSTVQDIWSRTRELDPSIGIATIYRTINLLSEMGVVNVIYLDGGLFRLENPEGKLHVSAFCRHCGAVLPLGGEEDKQVLIEKWLEGSGMELLPQSLAIACICRKCSDALREDSLPPSGQVPLLRQRPCPGRCRRRGRPAV